MMEKKKKSPYDDYMKMATDIYNEQKQQNQNQANNQSALAHAQYQEVNRNLNEINKAKGLNDTGYEGNTSVDAYNAYRNAVNVAQQNAQSTNNQLYSYYLSEMANLEQAKQNQAFNEEQFAYQKNLDDRAYNDAKTQNAITNLNSLKDANTYDNNGNITNESATRLWNYVTDLYGENIPNEIIAELNTEKGFDKWLKEYNKTGNTGTTNSSSNNNNVEWKVEGLGSGRNNDNITLTIGNNKYDLQPSSAEGMNDETKKALNKLATGDENKTPAGDNWLSAFTSKDVDSTKTPGKVVLYNDELYIYGYYGWRKLKDRKDKVSDAVTSWKNGGTKIQKSQEDKSEEWLESLGL